MENQIYNILNDMAEFFKCNADEKASESADLSPK